MGLLRHGLLMIKAVIYRSIKTTISAIANHTMLWATTAIGLAAIGTIEISALGIGLLIPMLLEKNYGYGLCHVKEPSGKTC